MKHKRKREKNKLDFNNNKKGLKCRIKLKR